ncbi:MAG: DNA internalization-related competence protein ComEC/Rec2 [Anaerolineae bacterium]|jgi:competence protein ComEC
MPPLVPIVVSWIIGLVVAHHWLLPLGIPPLSLVLLSVLPLAALALWWRDPPLRLGAACALALLAAALRYGSAVPNPMDPGLVSTYNGGGAVTLIGVVAAPPDVRDSWAQLTVEAQSVELDGDAHQVTGRVLVRVPRYPEYGLGDPLRVSGALETPKDIEGFPYRQYLAGKGIYSTVNWAEVEKLGEANAQPLQAALLSARDKAHARIAQLLPDPEASLLQGILLGTRRGIPARLYDDYNRTGVSHIIVISGSNIAIVAGLFSLVFGRILGKRPAYWVTIVGIVLYVLLVGADAAVLRAGLMGGLFATAVYLGRRATAYVSLLAAAALLTLIRPLALWDVGFQLSFAATLSLILFTPALEQFLARAFAGLSPPEAARGILRALSAAVVVTVAAQVLTLPLILYHFSRLSLVSPLANLLVVPVQPAIMTVGGAATLAGLVPLLAPLAQAFAWAAWLLLAYTNWVVTWLARWPLASTDVGQVGAGWLVAYYAGLAGMAWLWQRRGELARPALFSARRTVQAALSFSAVGVLLVWLAVFQRPDGRLHVAFLDVGQGDAVLITTPAGQQILVDGGPSPSALTAALGQQMAFWDHSLDLLIMTHADADHITGLAEVATRYELGGWLDNGLKNEDATYQVCLTRLGTNGVPRQAIQAGQELALGQGIVLEVLHPPPGTEVDPRSDGNSRSLVLRLRWGSVSFLLTGDIDAKAETTLLETGRPLEANVLKVAHHGSDGSSTAAFLKAVDPDYAVISVGADNTFGHPAPGVLERLSALGGLNILRTDALGTIEFVTDGQALWVDTEH